jgi:hypothetical protein
MSSGANMLAAAVTVERLTGSRLTTGHDVLRALVSTAGFGCLVAAVPARRG